MNIQDGVGSGQLMAPGDRTASFGSSWGWLATSSGGHLADTVLRFWGERMLAGLRFFLEQGHPAEADLCFRT